MPYYSSTASATLSVVSTAQQGVINILDEHKRRADAQEQESSVLKALRNTDGSPNVVPFGKGQPASHAAPTSEPADAAQAPPGVTTPPIVSTPPVTSAAAGPTQAADAQPSPVQFPESQNSLLKVHGARAEYSDGNRLRSCTLSAGALEVLQEIGREFVYLAEGAGFAYEKRTGKKLQRSPFLKLCQKRYGPIMVYTTPSGADDDGARTVNAGDVFWCSPGWLMRVHTGVIMRPTPEPEDPDADDFNLWHVHCGKIVKPAMSATTDDAAWYLNTVLNVICGGDQDAFKNHLDRLACQVQQPWQRINSFDYLVGPEGSGKTAVAFEVRKAIFGGALTTLCTGRELVKQFDDALNDGLFVVFDELKPSQGREIGETLRNLVTAGSGIVELKGKAAHKVTDRVLHISVCTNYEDAMPLNEGDRRANVMRSTRQMTDEERRLFFDNLSNPESVAKLVGFLHKVDLTEFDPLAPIPLTSSKRAVIAACRGDLFEDIKQLFEDRVPPFDRDLIKAEDAATSIRARYRLDPKALPARKLVGFLRTITGAKALEAKAVRVHRPGAREAKNERLLIIRNMAEWGKATPEDRGRHLGPDSSCSEPPRPFAERPDGIELATVDGEGVRHGEADRN